MSESFQENLFEEEQDSAGADERGSLPGTPLADRMRPLTLDGFVGQEAIVGPGSVLRRAIEGDNLRSLIFWGPPGCGKTTLAYIMAHQTGARSVRLSAVTAGIKDLRAVVEKAQGARRVGPDAPREEEGHGQCPKAHRDRGGPERLPHAEEKRRRGRHQRPQHQAHERGDTP